jgi:hypothetical protein
MNVKLKDGVYGFIWVDGEIGEVFTEKLSDKEIKLIYRVMHEDHFLVVDEEDIKKCFEWSDVGPGGGLDQVLELIK